MVPVRFLFEIPIYNILQFYVAYVLAKSSDPPNRKRLLDPFKESLPLRSL